MFKIEWNMAVDAIYKTLINPCLVSVSVYWLQVYYYYYIHHRDRFFFGVILDDPLLSLYLFASFILSHSRFVVCRRLPQIFA